MILSGFTFGPHIVDEVAVKASNLRWSRARYVAEALSFLEGVKELH
jgi:hypothetical protein